MRTVSILCTVVACPRMAVSPDRGAGINETAPASRARGHGSNSNNEGGGGGAWCSRAGMARFLHMHRRMRIGKDPRPAGSRGFVVSMAVPRPSLIRLPVAVCTSGVINNVACRASTEDAATVYTAGPRALVTRRWSRRARTPRVQRAPGGTEKRTRECGGGEKETGINSGSRRQRGERDESASEWD